MYRVNISLASCFGSNFACGDGSCQPLENRCNQRLDCSDGSDEVNCNTLTIDKLTYVKDYIPPSLIKDEKLTINMTVNVNQFLKLSETDSYAKIQFQLNLQWMDARLNYDHLDEDSERNVLTEQEKQNIWTPTIVFYNTKDKSLSINDLKSTILVKKQSQYRISPMSQVWKSKQYHGDKNPLFYYRTYSTEFICEFVLRNYPFDTQECFMVFNLPTRLENLLNVNLTSVKYDGEKYLAQYIVKEFVIMDMHDNTDEKLTTSTTKSSQVVKFVLKRRFMLQLFTVYIPTFCVLVIMHTTHYYPIKDFEASVMVGLTGMLVMTTLLLSISNNLPSTNYIKLIDIWMLFGMSTPFFDIIIHTIVGYYQEQIRILEEVIYLLADGS